MMHIRVSNTWRLLSLVCLAAWGVTAFEFEMQAQTKCIFEELNANVIVVGDYKAVNRDNPTVPIYIDLRVSSACWRCAGRWDSCHGPRG
jgi:hypothetical protein